MTSDIRYQARNRFRYETKISSGSYFSALRGDPSLQALSHSIDVIFGTYFFLLSNIRKNNDVNDGSHGPCG